ncbi:uncharacterized protein LOC134268824 [Saccostrea cucullata]|uniref:uncharacterized protein LOC134268824 n=1 Tax=Saccostrea cuccullata TaxID=36930 RepID=UPI002ECFF516
MARQIAFLYVLISFVSWRGLTYTNGTPIQTTLTSSKPTILMETTVTTTELMVTANISRCPLIIVTPGFISEYFGSSASFTGIVESYSDRALQSKWLKINSDVTEIVDITRIKYLGSTSYPYPKLSINDVNFHDDVDYQLQVQIAEGFCYSNIVNLEVKGILTFFDQCNMTKECNRSKELFCSSAYNSCMCRSAFYHRNRTCFSKQYIEDQRLLQLQSRPGGILLL